MNVPQPDAFLGQDTDPAAEAFVDRLAAEMTAAWRTGSRRRAEELLHAHAWLSAHPKAALRLIFEEVLLADEHGEAVSTEAVVRRFPQWEEQLRVMLDCRSLVGEVAAKTQFPQVGEVLDDFSILAELGRGGQGRVFLARQTSLADRAVVLKITPCEGQEHLSLARLQHTHIAPLFWAEDYPERNLRMLCMPFLGVVTLASLLHRLAAIPVACRSGHDVRRVLDDANEATPVVLPKLGPERERLAALTYVQAMTWVGACLADALHYAHLRGLLHLDLKPNNVLVAADGQPVILDFHLARRPVEAGAMSVEWLGGTPNYMSPEQEAALHAVAHYQPVPRAVDGRSDQYALGLLLFDMLGGRREDGALPRPHLLPQWNPHVSAGLTDILVRCLATDPERRYPDAAAVAADLRRHLDDLPLQGVANRSLRERWLKWRRRRPHALPLVAGILLSLAALMVGEVLVTRWYVERWQNADNALDHGKKQLKRGEFAEAARTFERGVEQAADLPGAGVLAASLDLHLQGARRGARAKDLHEFADQLRFHSILDPLPPRLHAVLDGSQNFWPERAWLVDKTDFPLEASVENALRTDLLDVAVLSADLRARLAPPPAAGAHRDALQLLAEAERLLGPSTVLARHRSAHARALGDAATARQAEQEARDRPPQSAWDQYALGRYWLLHGDLDHAAPALEAAIQLAPFDFLPRFYRGICAYRQKDFPRAVAEFTYCAGHSSDSWSFFHLGRAHSAAGQYELALQDYRLALKRDLTPSAVARPDRNAPPAEVHYELAQVHLARHDTAAARQCIADALKVSPTHAGALQLQKQLSQLP